MQQTLIKTFGILVTLTIFISSAYGVKPVWITPTDEVCVANGGKIDEKLCYSRWEESQKICEASGGELPSIDTLKSVITDCTGEVDARNKNQNNLKYSKCYKDTGFTMYAYWSNDTYEENERSANYVGFFYGSAYVANKRHFNYVRCQKSIK